MYKCLVNYHIRTEFLSVEEITQNKFLYTICFFFFKFDDTLAATEGDGFYQHHHTVPPTLLVLRSRCLMTNCFPELFTSGNISSDA